MLTNVSSKQGAHVHDSTSLCAALFLLCAVIMFGSSHHRSLREGDVGAHVHQVKSCAREVEPRQARLKIRGHIYLFILLFNTLCP